MGSVGILNVGAGDIVLTFDKNNPAERIRAGRIVKDMLRRGYALLVEVERDGEKCFERALDFDEKTAAYIIADFDPAIKPQVDVEDEHGKNGSTADAPKETPTRGRRGGRRKKVDAAGTRAVAVGRSAGG